MLLPIFEDAKKNQKELVTILKKTDSRNIEDGLDIKKIEKQNSYKKLVLDRRKVPFIKPKRWSSLQKELANNKNASIDPSLSPTSSKAKVPNASPSNTPLEIGKRKSSLTIDSIPKFSEPAQGPKILIAGDSLANIQSQLSDFINQKEEKETGSDFEKMLVNLDFNIKKTMQNQNVFNSLEKELEYIIESQLGITTDNRRKSRFSTYYNLGKDDIDSDLLFDDLKAIGTKLSTIENVL